MFTEKLKKFICQKENLSILLIFLLFYLFKTQFQNLIIFILDQIWLDGTISKIFTYNYTGELIGCEEVLQSQEILGNKSKLFYKTVTTVFFSFSLISYFLLLYRIKKNPKFDYLSWIFLAFFSFHLFDAIQFLLFQINDIYTYILKDNFLTLLVLEYSISVILAIILFFKFMNNKVKFQCLCIGVPSTYLGLFLWNYIGELIMPINYM